MAKLEISISVRWRKECPDLSKCSSCEEIIYSNKYTAYLMVNGRPLKTSEKITLCESCHTEMSKDIESAYKHP